MEAMSAVRKLFNDSKSHARERGIDFLFSFDEWVGWWNDQLGPDWMKLRGRGSSMFVMARNDDCGPYHPSNVKCITARENTLEAWQNNLIPFGEDHPSAKLTEAQALIIKKSPEKSVILANRYKVSRLTVNDIKARRRWKHLKIDK